ncbi:MAG: 2-phospho-L-lactate guanylyltransferase [Candidatus Tectomicrobia bacterium]|nr:2-phospho-L-lactate guanylyltransferase [Candidatus Tectomicrobia bacterium]
MTLHAIIPAKTLSKAKQRLSPLLTPEEREIFALAMLEDVLHAIAGVSQVQQIFVVTSDPAIKDLGRKIGVEIVEEKELEGQAPAVDLAIQVSIERGARSILSLPGDVPLVTSGDIEALIAEGIPPPFVVLIPSQEGGTNLLYMSPPDAIPPRFGGPSFPRHMEEVKKRNIPYMIRHLANLLIDIDTPQDLARLLEYPQIDKQKRIYREIKRMNLVERLSHI